MTIAEANDGGFTKVFLNLGNSEIEILFAGCRDFVIGLIRAFTCHGFTRFTDF